MAITESRLRAGTLTIGTVTPFDLSCQLTNVRLTSSYSTDGDAVETLCGDKIAPGEKADGYTLAGTFIQDFDTPTEAESAIWFLMDHNLEEMDFSYTPNVDTPTVTGKVRVKLPAEFLGGDVNTRITSDFEWQITTPLTRTPPVVTATASEPAETE